MKASFKFDERTSELTTIYAADYRLQQMCLCLPGVCVVSTKFWLYKNACRCTFFLCINNFYYFYFQICRVFSTSIVQAKTKLYLVEDCRGSTTFVLDKLTHKAEWSLHAFAKLFVLLQRRFEGNKKGV